MKKSRLIGMRIALVVLATIVITVTSPLQAQTNVYVSAAAADDNGNGQSWETAKKTIVAGISAAGANGTVFVKAGNYATTAEFTVPAGVTVMGGYRLDATGTDTSLRRLPGTNVHWTDTMYCTIITGAGTHRIATVAGILDGCVVRNGFTTTLGGGVLIDGGTVRYCVIKECVATEPDDTNAEGGGAYVRNDGTLINCVVTACRADNGAAVSGESGSLINNTITRNGSLECSTVTDYDGNVYRAVQIGSQCWMAENLRTTHYADGTTFHGYYHMQELDRTIYGLYYSWDVLIRAGDSTAQGNQGICPNGWHVPSSSEWNILKGYMCVRSAYLCNNNWNYIAKSLASTSGWNSYSSSCYVGYQQSNNNSSGFNAYPAGYISSNSQGNQTHQSASFWSRSTSDDSNYAYIYSLKYNDREFKKETVSKSNYYSVRCLKD